MKVKIIAEAGVNHNGSVKLAYQLIDIACEAGADAVKFQTFKAESLASSKAEKADYQKISTGAAESQVAMLKKLELSYTEFKDLKKYADSKNIEFLSTPFDEASTDFLIDDLKLKLIKIPSGEITNAPFLVRVAQAQMNVILSTGMSTLDDIRSALSFLTFGYTNPSKEPTPSDIKNILNSPLTIDLLKQKVTILQCTTSYPAIFSDINLRAIQTIKNEFDLPTGLSDHSLGIEVPIAAAALGATVIEKHFTIDKTLAGPDHGASLDPEELKTMVKCIRNIEQALGTGEKKPTAAEIKISKVARKSLIAAKTISKGEAFTKSNLTIKRPGTGISPTKLWEYLSQKSDQNYVEDDIIEQVIFD